jgi:hypothetical protein
MAQNIFDAPFYKPPATPTPYPNPLQLGDIVLQADALWTATSLTININSGAYPEGYAFRFAVPGGSNQGFSKVTWIAFMLPENTVCTLSGSTIPQVPNGSGSGTNGPGVPGAFTVDLIGNGAIQTVDISDYYLLLDLTGQPYFLGFISGIWRQVDYNDGWFQLCYLPNQQGPIRTFFFSDYSPDTPVALGNWGDANHNVAGSVNFPALTPPQLVLLSNKADGTGGQLALGASNAIGSTVIPATLDLNSRGWLNPALQSFTFTFIEPVKAFVDSISVQAPLTIDTANVFSENIVGTNYSSEQVQIAANVFENLSTTVTTTTTLQYTNSVQWTLSSQVTAGFHVTSLASLSAQVTVSRQSTSTTQSTSTKTVTTTQVLQLGQTMTFVAPPSGSPVGNASGTAPKGAAYSATATISLGTIQGPPPAGSKAPTTKELVVTTMGYFYYQQNLPGSQPDPAGSGLFILQMPITVAFAGSIGTQITFDVDDITATTAALIRQKSGVAALQPSLSHAATNPTPSAAHAVPAAGNRKRRKVARAK